MSLDRRSFLRIATLAASAAASVACRSERRVLAGRPAGYQGIGLLSDHERAVLDRVCYGVSPLEAERVLEIGLDGWIEEQLASEFLPEFDLRLRLRNLEVLDKDADALEGAYKKQAVIEQLRTGTLLRQIYSRRQIHEMMVEFWNDHFNTSVEKGPGWALKIGHDREVIRRHALASFHDLLSGSAHSPAMLVYLDNQANHAAAPNENYARELLELHTLGIDGGYGQDDIDELARCLTGWGVRKHLWRGRFEFDEQRHDPGRKALLGLQIEPSGQQEVEQVLAHLARHPGTARHLATKVVRRFICDDPGRDAPEWVGRLEQVYMLTRGNINALLRKLLLDGLARDPALLAKKAKRPVDYVVSALRITSAESDGGLALQRLMSRMGQPMFAWPTPDGPPDVAAHWLSNLAPRWEFSMRLMTGRLEGTSPEFSPFLDAESTGSPVEMLQHACEHLLGGRLPEPVSAELMRSVMAVEAGERDERMRAVIAGLLASPDFQYR